MRALLVSNMLATEANPALGSFVRDQHAALAEIEGLDVELYAFAPGNGSMRSYLRAARDLRRRFGGRRFDVVHAHFGLTGWAALGAPARARVMTMHGNDLHQPRSRRITRAALPFYDLVCTVSSELADKIPGAGTRRRVAVLPCGVEMDRFRPIDRREARTRLGLDPDGPYVLFCHNPARPDKRVDLAREVAGEVPLLTLGQVAPEEVPLWHNAANVVLVPSDYEGFGLAVLEALACDVPVVATRTGVHPVALDGLAGTLCADYDRAQWRAAMEPHLRSSDPRIEGRERAELFSSRNMALRVLAAWSELLGDEPALDSPAQGAPPSGSVGI